MSRVAIAGRMFSGKSTLADYLVEHHGWYRIGYTDLLKGYAAEFLTSLGVKTSVDDIIQDKPKYRTFLKDLGVLVGFNEGFGVQQSLDLWRDMGSPEPVIFDNVRFDAQFQLLRPDGFVLTELWVDSETRQNRAEDVGVSLEELRRLDGHFSENSYTSEVIIPTGEMSVEALAGLFVRMFGENKRRMQKTQQERIARAEGWEVNGSFVTRPAA